MIVTIQTNNKQTKTHISHDPAVAIFSILFMEVEEIHTASPLALLAIMSHTPT